LFYTIYQTTNTVNGKIYVGMHQTDDLQDDYLGSGKALKRAIRKYGEGVFSKIYIAVFDRREDMVEHERLLVNEDFVSRFDTYNLKVGGEGGWDHICENGMLGKRHSTESLRKKSEGMKQYIDTLSDEERTSYFELRRVARGSVSVKSFLGKSHTEQSKALMREHAATRTGSLNSSYGSFWVHNSDLRQSRRVKGAEAENLLLEGWERGRVVNFGRPAPPSSEPRSPKLPPVKRPPKPMSERNFVRKVTDDEYLEALRTSPSICQALIKLGLAPKGKNYTRAKRLLGIDGKMSRSNGSLDKLRNPKV
jgi:group I intron endonuclease